jgi:putative transposase
MESVAKIDYMNNYYLPLLPGEYYHIFNRGNNRNNIFYKKENYEYFLRKYDEYLSDFIDTYAFCLLPNHFHLLIRVKDITDFISKSDGISNVVSYQFRRFFISFSQAINKQENRVGSLFQKNFKRKKIDSEKYFLRLVYYIHANPQIHGLIDNFKLYPWSSYERILIDRPSKLKKDEVVKWFRDQKEYIKFHNQIHEINQMDELFVE